MSGLAHAQLAEHRQLLRRKTAGQPGCGVLSSNPEPTIERVVIRFSGFSAWADARPCASDRAHSACASASPSADSLAAS
jgi:hypothetical protein